MRIIKTVLAVVAIFMAITGIILGAVGIGYSWVLNEPVTNTLVKVADSAYQVLTVADEGITRITGNLNNARSAVNTIDGAVRATGETIVETDLAFEILDRTVGDTLFPEIVAARETAQALAETIVAVNTAVVSANELPFINLPTLTDELSAVAELLTGTRERVQEVRAELQLIKETEVGRAVTFITSITEPILEDIDSAQGNLDEAQTRVRQNMIQINATRARLPGLIDLASVAITVVLVWLIIAQLSLLIQCWRYLQRAG
jgi:hypothetical protein